MVIYENVIKDIGVEAKVFDGEQMIILFGDDAPDTLKDFCYIINVKNVNKSIEKGQILVIDDSEFKITAVGSIAEKNLINLGHITISFTADEEALLPGTIYVECKNVPKLKIGSKIMILEK